MLVLSRKLGEKIIVGDNIVLTVVEIKGRQIRLGVEAPKSMPVWRGELVDDDPQPIVAASRQSKDLATV